MASEALLEAQLTQRKRKRLDGKILFYCCDIRLPKIKVFLFMKEKETKVTQIAFVLIFMNYCSQRHQQLFTTFRRLHSLIG